MPKTRWETGSRPLGGFQRNWGDRVMTSPCGGGYIGEAKRRHQRALGFHLRSGPLRVPDRSFPRQRGTILSFPNSQGHGKVQHLKEIMGESPEKVAGLGTNQGHQVLGARERGGGLRQTLRQWCWRPWLVWGMWGVGLKSASWWR